MSVPGVYMHQVGVDLIAQCLQVGLESIQCAAQFLVDMRETSLAERVAFDAHAITADRILVTEGANFDMHQLGEFARQILNVNPGSAVDVRGVFARQ